MTDRVGQQFGNYRLTRLIDEGGTAEVYLGQHIYVKERQAAVKILHEFILDAKSLKDFQREATILARLKHPHVIQLLDFGVEGDIPFIVMTYAPGGNLEKKHPPGRRVPLNMILLYVRQIGEALQYAHEHNVVHSDLKPNNLLLATDGTLLIADFGFARLLQATSRSQTSHELGANFFYCAPEQFELQPPNPASDQYALGVIVYQWLCGQRPFDGTDPELLHQHLNELPLPLRRIIPELSPQIEQVVLKTLAKEPQQRFATTQQFVAALEEAAQPVISVSSADESQPSGVAVNQLPETEPANLPVQMQDSPVQGSPIRNKQAGKPPSGCAVATLLGGLLLLGLVLFLCPLTNIQRIASSQAFLQQATVHVQGTVISTIQSTTTSSSGGNTSSVTNCDSTIGFLPAQNSEKSSIIIHDGTTICPQVGDKVTIIYKPGHPDNAKTEGAAHDQAIFDIVFPLVAVIISLGVVGVGVSLFFRRSNILSWTRRLGEGIYG